MRLPLYVDDEIGDTLVDLLTILLLIFLLVIVRFTFSVLTVEFSSKENTFVGGMTMPGFSISPIRFSDKNIIYIYKHGEDDIRSDASLFGLTAEGFAGLIGFIDYGEIILENKHYPVFNIKLSEDNQNITNKVIINEEGNNGKIDKKILTDILKDIWPDYNIEELPENLFGSFKINKRPKIYYESLENNGHKMIVIGNIIIDVTAGISSYYKFIFDTLATEMMDFVYLGKFDSEERLRFLEKYGTDKALAYYKKWRENPGDMLSPLAKYNRPRIEYIKARVLNNEKLPVWVKGLFLDRIGVKLKIIGSRNGNIEAEVSGR
ncbi:MAG: hypothetical protein JRJ44_00035 [Deltaproteobacteria bacterium]|nr:hypothetical protein [Deltaproteobacteria bacterium]